MELPALRQLCSASSPAPALNRGLAVLALLNSRGASSLESIAADFELPKASVFRLLQTLQESGMVQKTADKHYKALWTLRPLHDAKTLCRQKLERKLPGLCRETGCTVEWYEPVEEGMKMVIQKLPDTEVRVQARPGFLRPWRIEFEAVARLAHAFSKNAPASFVTRMFVKDGVMAKIAPAQIRALLADARERKTAWDIPFNENGVRRYAAAAVEGGEFLGVLAIAEAHHFHLKQRTKEYLAGLAHTLASP